MSKRSEQSPQFIEVPFASVDDAPNLDLAALGLLAVLLRHGNGRNITLAEVGARYGYGEDAMAKAMGALQAARYVVKVRIMSAGCQWRTETTAFPTPAEDDDVVRLLDRIRREDPTARRTQVVAATSAATHRAARRRDKLAGLASGLNTSGWAYAIADVSTPHVKIGSSGDPEERLRVLQTAQSAPLSLVWAAPGGAALESHLHRHFADRQLRGEWFDFAGADALALIESAAQTFAGGGL